VQQLQNGISGCIQLHHNTAAARPLRHFCCDDETAASETEDSQLNIGSKSCIVCGCTPLSVCCFGAAPPPPAAAARRRPPPPPPPPPTPFAF
jgi:hypothetical protein